MNIFRIAAELFLIYLLYKLIFEFIIPVYNSSQKIRKQFNEMQNKMQQDINTSPSQPNNVSSKPNKVSREGDYIDYEEIK